MRALLIPLLLATATPGLSGCFYMSDDGNDEEAQTSDSVKLDLGSDEDGSDSGSKLAIKAEGFDLSIDIPDIEGDISSDGMYPGATITGMRILADETEDGLGGRVELAFTSPDDPAKVADWFARHFEDDDIAVKRVGLGMTGKGRDGETVDLKLESHDGGTRGRLIARGD